MTCLKTVKITTPRIVKAFDMGTITIEQYNALGSNANRDAPIADLNTLVKNDTDATTSTSAENIALTQNTRVVIIHAVEAHRVCVGTDTTGTLYATVKAGERRDFGVKPGQTLYYRADA